MNIQSDSSSSSLSSKGNIPEYDAFKVTLFYSALILILPILVFFASKTLIFDSIYSQNVVTSNVCSAGVAILVLHLALGAYIYRAYIATDKQKKEE